MERNEVIKGGEKSKKNTKDAADKKKSMEYTSEKERGKKRPMDTWSSYLLRPAEGPDLRRKGS